MKRLVLVLVVVVLYALHQDVWFWRTASPLLFGFLPIGITYHVGYTVAVTVLMSLLVKVAWPSQLEDEVSEQQNERRPAQASALSPTISDKEEDTAP